MGNIARVNIDLTRLDYIVPSERVSAEHRLRYGDIILNTRNTLDLVGKVSIWRNELPMAYYNSNILRLEFDNEYCGCSSYFGYALNSKRSIDRIRALATGTTSVAAIYTRDLLKLNVLVPPPDEQLRIASALTDADDLIGTLESTIAKKEALKRGVMQQLLTGETRLPGFQGAWEERSMGSLGTTYGGLVGKTREDFGIGLGRYIPFMAVMANVQVATQSLVRVRVDKRENQNIVRSGDLLFNTSSETPDELAMCAVAGDIPVDTYLNSFCFGFRLTAIDVANPLFLAYIFRSEVGRRLMYTLAQGATRYNLSKSRFRNVIVMLPPVEEQRAIASVLSDADSDIRALRDSHAKAKSIKQGMMQQLLTGRTRLPVAEEKENP
jgi:type I restriction enzyme S subunit